VISLPKFDADAYEEIKAKAKTGGEGHAAILDRMLENARRAQRAEEAFDPGTDLPRLPPGQPPFPTGIPGLPPYRIDGELPERQREATDPLEPKLIYSAPATQRKVKMDPIDKKVEDFLKGLL